MVLRSVLSVTGAAQPPKVGNAGRSRKVEYVAFNSRIAELVKINDLFRIQVDRTLEQDQFVARFHAMPKDVTIARAAANFPALRGNYDDWRQFIRDAVEHDAAPSKELIAANEMLAAWEAHLGVGKVDSFPVTAGFVLTDVCNARCSFCPYVPERVTNSRLTLDKLERADWLKFCKNFTPNGGGLGEPFAHSQILEVLRIFKRNAPYINFGGITNGSLLRDEVIEELVGYASYLYISMHAARKETYEETLKPLKWNRLIANLEKLSAAKSDRNALIPRLRCGYVVHAYNVEELPELPHLLRDLGFMDLNVNPMMPPPPSDSRPLFTKHDSIYTVPEIADHAFRRLEEECARYEIPLVKPLPSLVLLRAGHREAGDAPSPTPSLSYGRPIRGTVEDAAPVITAPDGSDAAPATPLPDHRFAAGSAGVLGYNLRGFFSSHSDSPIPQEDAEQSAIPDIAVPTDGDGSVHGISNEWVRFAAQGEAAFCWLPWRMLKIDMLERTMVCCNFSHRLPTFEWPTAKDFHRETGMWNHPFMQHLRATMGTNNEVSYCTFCKTVDKRYAGNSARKKVVRKETIDLYEQILHDARKDEVVGGIDRLDGDLRAFAITVERNGEHTVHPFTREKIYYRGTVRQRGFFRLGRVLTAGRGIGGFIPFLAEANDAVTVVHTDKPFLLRTQRVCKQFNLSNLAYRHIDDLAGLGVGDGHFDGIWMDGGWLTAFGRRHVLAQCRRLLRKDGRLHIASAPSLRARIKTVVDNDGIGAEAEAALAAMANGSVYDGVGGYLTSAQIAAALRPFGFDTDKALPPAPRRGNLPADIPARGSALAARLEDYDFRNRLRMEPGLLNAFEDNVSFTAVVRPRHKVPAMLPEKDEPRHQPTTQAFRPLGKDLPALATS